jgi:hypothetical protein
MGLYCLGSGGARNRPRRVIIACKTFRAIAMSVLLFPSKKEKKKKKRRSNVSILSSKKAISVYSVVRFF